MVSVKSIKFILLVLILMFFSSPTLFASKMLVVIDMQTGFKLSSNENLLHSIIAKIEEIKNDHGYIVFLEMEKSGPTQNVLKDHVQGYPRFYSRERYLMNGSKEIIELIKKEEMILDEIIFAGIHTHACVESTIKGMYGEFRKRIPLILYVPGTNASYYDDHISALERMKKYIKWEPEIGGNESVEDYCKRVIPWSTPMQNYDYFSGFLN